MFPDPIIEELREIRKAHGEAYENDLDKIVAALREDERKSSHVFENPGPILLSSEKASEEPGDYGRNSSNTDRDE